MTQEVLISIIQKYFPELTEQQREQFEQLKPLYTEWNEKINVISRKDIDLLEERHVLHSLGIAKVMKFKAGTKILDVGTGGGFPGIPLAILFPQAEFLLVDGIGKKIKVVNEISAALGLKNVVGRQQTAIEVKEKFDFIVSRAVTDFPVFHKWIRDKFLKENKNEMANGILCLKGGDLKGEFGPFYERSKFFELKEYFEEEFFATKKVVYYRGDA